MRMILRSCHKVPAKDRSKEMRKVAVIKSVSKLVRLMTSGAYKMKSDKTKYCLLVHSTTYKMKGVKRRSK